MHYDLAIFDLDGTILNTLGDLTQAVNFALTRRGYSPRTIEEVRTFVGNGVGKLMERSVPAGTDAAIVAACLADFKTYYAAHLNIKTQPYPGVQKVLAQVRAAGLKIAICSNKFDAAVQELCQAHFAGLYDLAIGESEIIPRKPSPIGANHLMKTLGVPAARTVYIGDSGVDIQTAKNAGLPCICVTWGFRSRAEQTADGGRTFADTADELTTLILRD